MRGCGSRRLRSVPTGCKIRYGWSAERARQQRMLHDTVEMARDGLRARLLIPSSTTTRCVRQIAIRAAVREALRKTMKHAGTDQVVVRRRSATAVSP